MKGLTKMKNKKIITVLLAALMIISIGALLSGCGEEETKKTSKPKETSKVTETTAETRSSDIETEADTDSQIDEDEADQDDDSDDIGIDQQTAVANVREQAGSGAKILSVEKGTSPDGSKAWVIVVEPITNGKGPDTVTYYSGYQFCYADTSSDDSDTDSSSDSYIDRQTAVANVRQQAGSGAKILSVEKGTASDGSKAWVIVVEPITNGEGPDTVTYYVNDGFCYTE